MQHKVVLSLLVVALAFGMLESCAKQGYPSGGPVDSTAPIVIATEPPSGTGHFTAKEFTLQVDEYVTIKDADNNVLISPPMLQKPEYVVRGHKIIVRIKDTLKENTTYLFQFKGAIVDFNEGNALQSYEYVFSTGEGIDSMTLRGRVVDAFTLKPAKESVSVLAYCGDAEDSVVLLEYPRYYTRCDTGGYFAFNHIAAGRYRLVAIVDADRNMQLTRGEAIAFLDSAVTAMPMPRESEPQENMVQDSVLADSTAGYAYVHPDRLATHLMRLSLIPEADQQRVTGSKALSPGHFQITTKTALSSQYSIRQLMTNREIQLYSSLNAQCDTLDVWTAPERLDSIVLLLADTELRDTMILRYQKRAVGRHGTQQLPELLKVKSLVPSQHPYYDTLRLWMGTLAETDTAKRIRIMSLKDSTESVCVVRLLPDQDGERFARRGWIDFSGEAGTKYRLRLPAGIFRDIYGQESDSLEIITTYTKPENYGTISLEVESRRFGQGGQLLVQLLNEKYDVVQQKMLTEAGRVTFPHLLSGKYTFRIVHDTDADGQWTPGNYWLGRQPEDVTYMGKVFGLRENWEITERFHW